MPTPLELTKMFQVSKMNTYFDGDIMPYVASTKIPGITSPTEEYDNTSTGGKIQVADAHRKQVMGPGELKAEQVTASILSKMQDSARVTNLKLSFAVNAYNPQLARFLPMPILYTLGAQFYEMEEGEIKQGGKRDITAKYNMFTYKVVIGGAPVAAVDYDFMSGTFFHGGVDLMTAINAII